MFFPNCHVSRILYFFICCDLLLVLIETSLVLSSHEKLPSTVSYPTNYLKTTTRPDVNLSKSSRLSLYKRKLKKRYVQKALGEKCFKFSECSGFAICLHGICSCDYDHYAYPLPQQPTTSVCRKKVKFGLFCTLTEDCKAYDQNSLCLDGLCRCVNGTHFIVSRNLLSYDRKCYKILEREGDECKIDEQCSRLADNHHKCRCLGICDCTAVDRYGGCSICHENIKRTFFGGAAFIVLLLTSRLFTRMRQRSDSTQDRNSNNTLNRRTQMLPSSTVPTVSLGSRSLQNSRRVASSLPNVFLIDRQNFNGMPSSQTTHFLSNNYRSGTSTRGRHEDAPPSYDDILESDQLVWNEPPPAYEEVAMKYIPQRRP